MRANDWIALLSEAATGWQCVEAGGAGQVRTIAAAGTGRAEATVRLADRWIGVEAAWPDEPNPQRRLIAQSAMPAGLKLVRAGGATGLRADIPILGDTAAAREWLRRQLAAVLQTLLQLLDGDAGSIATMTRSNSGFAPAVLAEQCTAAGWDAQACGDDCVRVAFDSRGLPRVAILGRRAGGIHAAVRLELGGAERQHAATRLAITSLLSCASRRLRWARSFALVSADDFEAGFECWLAMPADDRPVLTALDALATACHAFAREAEALAHSEALARQYLAVCAGGLARAEMPVNPVPQGGPPASRAATVFATA